MKALVLSDIHIGDPRFNQDSALCELLKKDYDHVILNGDIIDSWFDYEEAAQNSQFLYNLDYLKNVVWVRGNHDPKDTTINKMLPLIKVVETYKLGRYFFIHGHQVYPNNNSSSFDRWSTRLNAWLNRWFGLDLQRVYIATDLYKNRCKGRRQQVLNAVGALEYAVVMGHTHVQTTQIDGGKIVYDGGSVMCGGFYIEIDNGTVSFKKL